MRNDGSGDGRVSGIREAVAKLCAKYPGEYWRALDRDRAYPTAFVKELTEGGYLSVLIPRRSAAAARHIRAAAILEEVQKSGGNGGPCHAQMYTMGTLLRHGTEDQKKRYLPRIAAGSCACRPSG